MSTISTKIAANVTLGSASYPSPLTITSTGIVAPTENIAVYSDVAGNQLTNYGAIDGGYAAMGLDLLVGKLANYGHITGGGSDGSLAGGVGVNLARGGSVLNHGSITGGKNDGDSSGAGVMQDGGKLTNYANITGGTTNPYVDNGLGGSGVDFSAGTLMNLGHITGGNGGVGGAGVYVGGGTLTNAEQITGGNGFATDIGAGGMGVDLVAGILNNNNSIIGGVSAAGVRQSGGTLNNNASIAGGHGNVRGSLGGAGVDLVAGRLNNFDDISGGTGVPGGASGAGVLQYGGVLTNSGTITGGVGGSRGDAGTAGGNGVNLHAGALTNTGSIVGGAGGGGLYKGSGVGAPGGAGVYMGGGTLTTSGTISGGQGGGADTYGPAGDAVQFSALASTLRIESGAVFNGAIGGFAASDTIDITNLSPTQVAADFNPTTFVLSTASDGTLNFTGAFTDEYFVFTSDGNKGTDVKLAAGIARTVTATVTLGSETYPSPLTVTASGVVSPTVAGATGVISAVAGASLTNFGAIQGSAGASGNSGGGGGPGVNFSASGTVTNSGSITGAAGGNGKGTGGHGGAGVILNGGTLSNAGTISGGAGGTGTTTGAAGDAVQFGAAASTLIVDPGAVFNGLVAANASVNDVLELSGTQSGGTAITLGTQFTNFSTLEFASGATGTVEATIAALTHHALSIEGFGLGDTLDITNLAAKGTSDSFNTTTDVLTITKGATVINLTFDSAFAGDHFVLTANGAGSDLTLSSGASADPSRVHGFSLSALVERGFGHEASMGLHT